MDKYLGTTLDDRYEIQEIIGSGGMAVVYKATDNRLHRSVAVKILRDELAADEEFRRRFQTEAQAVAMLSHPNIVSVYDVSHSESVEYIVMELIEGVTLMQYMQKKGALGWKEALHFSVQISKALEHAHSKGIVHRDIKPQNIMIIRDGSIKVADFGIAALESTQEQRSSQTVGSVHYIAPEQARGEQPDTRSDIYSLGVVMYEMLTGRMPYDGETAEQIALKHIAGIAVPPQEINPDIPDELARITLKAMNADINARYQSASELLADLEEFRKQQAAANRTSSDGEEGFEVVPDVEPIGRTGEMSEAKYARRRKRSRKVSIMSGAVGVLVFMVAVFVFLWNYWLRDIFSTAERIELPNFVGRSYESVVNDSSYTQLYAFTVTYSIDPTVPEGEIISQDPEAGRSLMIVPEKIAVTLTVSTGVREAVVPDVLNSSLQEAVVELQNSGFKYETNYVTSDVVTEGYVISTDPAPGSSLAEGSTVFLTISSGPTIHTVTMPNLVGHTESEAISILQSNNLTYADTTYIESEQEEGTVIRQSIDAYEDVSEHTRIYLWVSSGPAETPEPTPPETGEERSGAFIFGD
ncbi:MAG TPA: Stk1 family PASTA domain-containing Ser/Thr kinase [Candidatus Scatomorpha merdipullorum]|uniref:non-specific serine/threonine protein kinase n=1 Tax=Candidatus Scatomorpha merdipullorum TaxID=2840927 RepID=A0A9D1FCW8_9FIRM|nr:Stk1 family PASTA domain-containing Ser/Thr kinase [Candidatus Scatomorpha merdipullorum]